jgi:AcrR family transcriptional regulator
MRAVSDRTADILEAACRVIAREGADGLRMGQVAREAGVSSALIHYYFATRADLLLRAFEHADEQADLTIDELIGDLPTGAAKLERVLIAYAVGTHFRSDWILWVEMWRGAIFDERLRPVVRSSNDQWVEEIADLIRGGRSDGSIGPGGDEAGVVATRLTALVDGLGLQVLTGIMDHDRAGTLVRGAIAAELEVTPSKETVA